MWLIEIVIITEFWDTIFIEEPKIFASRIFGEKQNE